MNTSSSGEEKAICPRSEDVLLLQSIPFDCVLL